MAEDTSRSGAIVPLLLIFFLIAFHLLNCTTDDAFITFRYAENLALGNGLVFNPGERVEGYSNFLWAVTLSGLVAIGATGFAHGLLVWAKALGLLCGLATVIVTFQACRMLAKPRGLGGRYALLAPVILATSPQLAAWSVAGLETSLCALLVVLAQLQTIRLLVKKEAAGRSGVAVAASAGLFYLLASLARPEIPILFVAACLTVLLSIRPLVRATRLLAAMGATFGLPYAAFLAWRLDYYGDIFPNTFYAKTAGARLLWLDGLKYWGFGAATIVGPLILLAFLALVGGLGRDRVYLFLVAQFSALGAFMIYCGGDWMGSYRLFIPILPAIALMAQSGAYALWQLAKRQQVRRWGRVAVAVFVVGVCLYHLFDVEELSKKPSGFCARDAIRYDYYQIARMMRNWLLPGTAVALGEAGLIPYYSKLNVIDCRGLTDRYIARLKGKLHAKFDPMYVFKRKPDYILLVDVTGRTWCEHNYENMLLDHAVLAADYRLVGDERTQRLFWRYHFLLFTRRGFLLGSRME